MKDYNWPVKIIGMTISTSLRQNQITIVVSRALKTIRKIIAEDDGINKKYFASIERAIETKNHPYIINLYQELLEYKKGIKVSYISDLLTEILSHYNYLDRALAHRLADYFANEIKEEQKSVTLQELKKIISFLNSYIEEYPRIEKGILEWLISLAVFYLQGDSDEESERVFLYALESAFIQEHDPYLLQNFKGFRNRAKITYPSHFSSD